MSDTLPDRYATRLGRLDTEIRRLHQQATLAA
jgi:hypothetical protein